MNEQSIISTLNLFYDLISVKVGESGNWDKLRQLFCKGAVLTPYFISDESLDVTISYNVDGYVQKMESFLKDHSFHEKGYNYKVDIYGNIANVSSEYSSEIIRGNETYMRKGVNLVQLVKKGDEWKIVSMLWEHAGERSY